MYIIIKKHKAESLAEKLHKIKNVVCDVMEELEIAASKEYEEEDVFRHEHSRHEGRYHEGRRHEDDFENYDRDYSRGGRGGMRASRGRY